MSQDSLHLPPELADLDLGVGSELDLKEYFHKILRHWKLVCVVAAICAAAGAVKTAVTPKQYQAKALLQIERHSLSQLAGDQNFWFENFWNLEFYPTQEVLLKSRGLAEDVVIRERLLTDSQFGGSVPPADAEASAEADKAAVARMAMAIQGGLTVRRRRDTQIIDLEYRADSAAKAARMANAFAEAYIEMGLQQGVSTADDTTDLLGIQATKLQEEIAGLELQIGSLGREKDIVDLDPTSDTMRQSLQSLNQDVADAELRRLQMETRYRALVGQPDIQVAEANLDSQVNALRTELRELEQEVSAKQNVLRDEHPDMQDLLIKLETTRRNLAKAVRSNANQVREAARSAYLGAQKEQASLEARLRALRGQTLDERSSRSQLSILMDEVKTKREALSRYNQTLTQARVASSMKEGRASNVHVVETALPPGGPFRPSLKQDLSLGLLLGVGLGLGIAFLLEFLDRTIKTSEELEQLLKMPTLAVIPDVFDAGRGYGYAGYGYGSSYGLPSEKSSRKAKKWKGRREGEAKRIELLPHDQPRVAVSEAYRALRTALLLSSAQKLEIIAVTSAESGEGKTATAANLAVVMAQLGRNVLVIDGDLRKARQHEVFKLSNRTGLVNFLTGTVEAREIVFPTEIPNLYVCPSGPTPPNPSELLSSERMRAFLVEVRQRFDFIIFDTPPTLAVTDSTLIGAITDGVVLCCRAGRLQREDARACRDRLRFAEVKTLGTVLNAFRATATSSSYARKSRYYDSYMAEVEEQRSDSAA